MSRLSTKQRKSRRRGKVATQREWQITDTGWDFGPGCQLRHYWRQLKNPYLGRFVMFDSVSAIFAAHQRLDELWCRAYYRKEFSPLSVPVRAHRPDFTAMSVFITESVSLNRELSRRFPEYVQRG